MSKEKLEAELASSTAISPIASMPVSARLLHATTTQPGPSKPSGLNPKRIARPAAKLWHSTQSRPGSG